MLITSCAATLQKHVTKPTPLLQALCVSRAWLGAPRFELDPAAVAEQGSAAGKSVRNGRGAANGPAVLGGGNTLRAWTGRCVQKEGMWLIITLLMHSGNIWRRREGAGVSRSANHHGSGRSPCDLPALLLTTSYTHFMQVITVGCKPSY